MRIFENSSASMSLGQKHPESGVFSVLALCPSDFLRPTLDRMLKGLLLRAGFFLELVVLPLGLVGMSFDLLDVRRG